MAYSAVALLAFFAAFHNADGVLGGDSMATAERTQLSRSSHSLPHFTTPMASSVVTRWRLPNKTACQPRSGDAYAPGAAIRKLPAAARSWTQAARRPLGGGGRHGGDDGASQL